MTFKEYRQYDALGLGELVNKGEVSAIELLEIAIQRAEEVNPTLNAILHQLYDQARVKAASNTADSPFAGVPFLIKDLGLELADTPLRVGSKAYEGYTSSMSSHVVELFEQAGLIIFGKTNTPEFGLTPFTEPEAYGATRNPWDTSRTAGGSSGGSASAVAAGIVPMATASDGGGSIRIPASNCGLFGLKPSRARLSLGPQVGEAWGGAVVEGCNSRSVRDTAAFLDQFAKPCPGELYFAPAPEKPFLQLMQQDPGKLRIGFSTTHTLDLHVDDACKAAVEDAATLLSELGHEVEEVKLPFFRDDLAVTFLQAVVGNVNATLRIVSDVLGRPIRRGDVENNTYALYLLGNIYSSGDYAYHKSHWNQLARRMGHFHEQYDLLLTPTVAKEPFPVGALQLSAAEKRLVSIVTRLKLGRALKANINDLAEKTFDYIPYTPIANMTGQPSMSVPLYWTEQQLPVGVMLTSAIYREDLLLQLARQLEEARPWMNRMAEVN